MPPLETLPAWGIVTLATAGVIVRPFRLPEAVWALAGAAALVLLGQLSIGDALAGRVSSGGIVCVVSRWFQIYSAAIAEADPAVCSDRSAGISLRVSGRANQQTTKPIAATAPRVRKAAL